MTGPYGIPMDELPMQQKEAAEPCLRCKQPNYSANRNGLCDDCNYEDKMEDASDE